MAGWPGNFSCNEGGLMRWPPVFQRRPAPPPASDLAAVAAMGFAEGSRLATLNERARCAAILQNPIAEQNRSAAELLAFGTDMDAAAAVRLLTEVGNLAEAQQRTGPNAAHYVQAAQTINERKSSS